MKSLYAWIAMLATTTFLAGAAAGLLLAEGWRGEEPERGAFATYHELLVERFGLDSEREALLRDLLWHYDRRIEDLKFEKLEAARDELARLGTEYRGEVRRLLPPERQAEFDRLLAPVTITP